VLVDLVTAAVFEQICLQPLCANRSASTQWMWAGF